MSYFRPALLLALFWISIVSAASLDSKRVLILHSYNQGLTWTDSEDEGIRKVLLGSGTDLLIHTEYLDSKTHYDEKQIGNLISLFRGKYSDTVFDVVIATDDDAYRFFRRFQESLFARTSLVFCGVNYFTDQERLGSENRMTGVIEAFDIASTLELALKFHPKTRQIVIVNDLTTTGLANRKVLDEKIIPKFKERVSFRYLDDLSVDELRKVINRVGQDEIILLMTFNKDKDGNVLTYDQSIRLVKESSRVPIYGVWDFFLGKGIVGGMLTSGIDQGRLAGEMALKILSGVPVHDIPIIQQSPNRVKIDHSYIMKFGIDEDLIPKNAIIINKPSSFYELNKNIVWGFLFSLLALAIIVILLLVIIAQRRKAETVLRESEEFRKRVFDSSPIPIVVMDSKTFKYIDCNPAAVKAYGFSKKENVVGTVPMDHSAPVQYDGTDSQQKAKYFIEKAKTEKQVVFEWRHQRPDGVIWDAQVHLLLFKVEKKEFLQFTLLDVTEMRKAEKEKESLQIQLLQSQKMESIGRLAGGVAHDFNNMLAGIMGAAQLLKLTGGDPQKNEEYVDLIVNTAEKAAGLTSKLLSFSRKNMVENQIIDVDAVLQDTLSILSRSIDKRIRIDLDLRKKGILLKGDSSQLANALLNMGINSAHAMPQGGTIRISSNEVFLDENDCKKSLFPIQPGRFLEIAIKDSGHGIPKEIIGNIFEPFFTTKPKGKGTGLGLSTVYGMIQAHQGTVRVESELGIGTEFKIHLPLIEVDLPDSKVAQSQKMPKGKGKILIIDDEEVIRRIVAAMLMELGYEVLLASNGKEGVALFSKEPQEFKIIILDMLMPEMDGKETFHALKNIDKNVKIIVASGFSDSDDIRGLKRSGLTDLLVKPYKMEELAKVLEKWI